MSRKITVVVGARPNFIKAAPLMRQLRAHADLFESRLIHTGQHYDHKMSQLFFDDLRMSKPDIYLGIGSGSHAVQTAAIMIELEKAFIADRPDLVVVFGDINSTMAAAIVAAKLVIPLAHVEAGLRSFDLGMPEEINRIVTDRLSTFHFVSEQSGLDHLQDEGTDQSHVYFTGNIMIDSLVHSLVACKESTIMQELAIEPDQFVLMTLHRPSNVDDKNILGELLALINDFGHTLPIIFPCHPRTAKEIQRDGLLDTIDKSAVRIVEPLGYLDFLHLQMHARFILTDSGGIQEETTYLQKPCITLRENTERPVTISEGTNILTGLDFEKIRQAVKDILSGKAKKGRIPKLWDGHTAERIVDILIKEL